MFEKLYPSLQHHPGGSDIRLKEINISIQTITKKFKNF